MELAQGVALDDHDRVEWGLRFLDETMLNNGLGCCKYAGKSLI